MAANGSLMAIIHSYTSGKISQDYLENYPPSKAKANKPLHSLIQLAWGQPWCRWKVPSTT